ncbi:hypothetical protein OQA88_2601 [Cercophora sp. LCS_1]
MNPISRMVKGKKKSDLRPLQKIREKRKTGDDSDLSDSSDDDSIKAIRAQNLKRKQTYNSNDSIISNTDTSSRFKVVDKEDLDYAPLFGNRKLMWHTKIPLVRRLWEYKTYQLDELRNLDAGLEDLDWDYPLSRWRKNAISPVTLLMGRLGLQELGDRYARHERDYRKNRQSDELIRELEELQRELRILERAGLEKGGGRRGRLGDVEDDSKQMRGFAFRLLRRGTVRTERRVEDEEG